MDQETFSALVEVVAYYEVDEMRHWHEAGMPKDHIYHALSKLNDFIWAGVDTNEVA
jgi:hypothetical protein